MKYDFTTQVSRENTGSSKWDGMYAANPNVPEGTVPFSVADMEFKNPPQIAEGIGEYLKNSIMGYTFATDAYYDAVIGWMKRRHNWDIKKEWIVEYPGVVPAPKSDKDTSISCFSPFIRYTSISFFKISDNCSCAILPAMCRRFI